MFYSLADCLAKRREHAVVQVPWPESHHTRVHRPCERSKCSTDVRKEQGLGPCTPCLQAGGAWPKADSARIPRSEGRTRALPVGEGGWLPLHVQATRSPWGWAGRPSPLVQERRAWLSTWASLCGSASSDMGWRAGCSTHRCPIRPRECGSPPSCPPPPTPSPST